MPKPSRLEKNSRKAGAASSRPSKPKMLRMEPRTIRQMIKFLNLLLTAKREQLIDVDVTGDR